MDIHSVLSDAADSVSRDSGQPELQRVVYMLGQRWAFPFYLPH